MHALTTLSEQISVVKKLLLAKLGSHFQHTSLVIESDLTFHGVTQIFQQKLYTQIFVTLNVLKITLF